MFSIPEHLLFDFQRPTMQKRLNVLPPPNCLNSDRISGMLSESDSIYVEHRRPDTTADAVSTLLPSRILKHWETELVHRS
jgi:hypothetical protein